jgi:hypothetical protein
VGLKSDSKYPPPHPFAEKSVTPPPFVKCAPSLTPPPLTPPVRTYDRGTVCLDLVDDKVVGFEALVLGIGLC